MIQILQYSLCFFPFVKLIPIGLNLDTQPWAVLFSAVYVAGIFVTRYGKVKLPKLYCYVLVLACLNVVLVILFSRFLPYDSQLNESGNQYTIMRNLISVASMLCITLASYLVHNKYGIQEKICKIIINIWFATALIQKYVIPEFMYSLIANARTSSNRGVLGYASEPSFYGYMCLLMLLFVYDFQKDRFLYFTIIMLQLIVLAESSNGLLLFSCFALFFILKMISLLSLKNITKIGVIGAGVMIGAWKILQQIAIRFPGKRIGVFIGIMLSDIKLYEKVEIFLKDGSIAKRLENITQPIGAFIKDFGLPHGLMTVRDVSGFAGWLFQYGMGGLLIIILLFIIIRNGYSKSELGRAFAYSFVAIMTIGIQVTNPTIWLYVGYCMARGEGRKKGILSNRYLERSINVKGVDSKYGGKSFYYYSCF